MKRLAVLLAAATSALAQSITPVDIPNGDFDTLYKPGTQITGRIFAGGWNSGVGAGTPIESGVYEFDDSTTGLLADIPGWVGYDADGWIAFGGTYGRDQLRGPGDNQGAIQAQGVRAGVMGYAVNGGQWGNQSGGLITSSDALTTAGSGALVLSMWAFDNDGGATPVVLDLLADGVPLVPTASEDPAWTGDWVQFTRTYDSSVMSSVAGQSLTVVLGVDRDALGTQTRFDDVTLEAIGQTGTAILVK